MTYVNQWSDRHVEIVGMRLVPGATIQARDVYDSTDGSWREAGGAAQLVIRAGCQTIWVRPQEARVHSGELLSANASILLGYLAQLGGTYCIAKPDNHRATHYLLPTPNWNWDGRVS